MNDFEKVADIDEIPDLGRKSVFLDDDIPALVLRVGETYYCIEDVCTHDGQPLTDGAFDGVEIVCPRHGARFDVKSGRPTKMPATEPVRTFQVQVRDDGIYVQCED